MNLEELTLGDFHLFFKNFNYFSMATTFMWFLIQKVGKGTSEKSFSPTVSQPHGSKLSWKLPCYSFLLNTSRDT